MAAPGHVAVAQRIKVPVLGLMFAVAIAAAGPRPVAAEDPPPGEADSGRGRMQTTRVDVRPATASNDRVAVQIHASQSSPGQGDRITSAVQLSEQAPAAQVAPAASNAQASLPPQRTSNTQSAPRGGQNAGAIVTSGRAPGVVFTAPQPNANRGSTTTNPGTTPAQMASAPAGEEPVARPPVQSMSTLLDSGRAMPVPGLTDGQWGTSGPSLAPNLVRDEQGNFWIDLSQPFWNTPAPPGSSTSPPSGPQQPAAGPTGGQPGQGGGNPQQGAQGTQAPPVPVLDPRYVALDVLHEVPLPNIQVRMSPAFGLVALPAWFWVEGYDGRPFGSSRTITLPPLVGPEVPFSVVPAADPRRRETISTVEVRVWPSRYEWSFGDGTAVESRSLGQAYPQESEVRHTYQRSSLGFTSGFPVQLTVEFSADYSVNGGPRQPLATARRTYSAAYRVREIQAVLAVR